MWKLPPRSTSALLSAMVLAAFPTSARASCTLEDLERVTAASDAAFKKMDGVAYKETVLQAERELACLEQVAPAATVAGIFDLEGRLAFLEKDKPRAVEAYRSVLRIDPAFTVAPRIVPEGHPLDRIVSAARDAEPLDSTAVDPAIVDGLEAGTLYVNGVASSEVPAGLAFLQITEGDAVAWSHLQRPGEDLPERLTAPAATVPVVPMLPISTSVADAEPLSTLKPAKAEREKHGPKTGLVIGTGSAFVVSGGLLAGALVSRSQFLDPETSYEDLDGLESRTASLSIASEATLGVAVALGVVTVFSARW